MKTLANQSEKEESLRRIALVTPGARARWGKMSAHQMMCHLCDSFRLALGERQASPASGLFQRTVMKFGALYVPLPWPHGIATRPEMEQGVAGTPPLEFEKDRAELCALLERFCAAGQTLASVTHPIFGAMTVQEWMRWGYLHTDHHVRQFGA